MEIMIRISTPEDWEQISTVSRKSGYEDYINHIGPDYLNEGVVLVLDEGGITGFSKIEFLQDNSVWLSGLRVDPDHWRSGIGTRLTEASMKMAAERNCTTARMIVADDNYRSLNLVEKKGFRKVEKYYFYSGVVNLEGFQGREVDYDGFLNFGWKFASVSGKVRILEHDGWTVAATNARTTHIISAGTSRISLKGDGFTSVPSGIDVGDILEEFREPDFRTGYLLEKPLS